MADSPYSQPDERSREILQSNAQVFSDILPQYMGLGRYRGLSRQTEQLIQKQFLNQYCLSKPAYGELEIYCETAPTFCISFYDISRLHDGLDFILSAKLCTDIPTAFTYTLGSHMKINNDGELQYAGYNIPTIGRSTRPSFRKLASLAINERFGYTVRYSKESRTIGDIIIYSFVDPLTFFNIAKSRDKCVDINSICQSTINQFIDTIEFLQYDVASLHSYLITTAIVLRLEIPNKLKEGLKIGHSRYLDPQSKLEEYKSYVEETMNDRVELTQTIVQAIWRLNGVFN